MLTSKDGNSLHHHTKTTSAVFEQHRSPNLSVPISDGFIDHRESARQRELSLAPVLLTLNNVRKSYPIKGSKEVVVVLHGISLSTINSGASESAPGGAVRPAFDAVRRGEFVMIRGPSGGGKTTLLNIIGTIDSCTDGDVELSERRIDKDTPESHLAKIRLNALGFVFQTFNLIPTMSAAENVELPMTLQGKLSSKERRKRSHQLLALVGLRNRLNHLPSELSGGEQQRVTIARSLANNPSLLLLDEPTGDLDTVNTIEVMDLLLRINRMTMTTCIMVTHNPDIECYADRVLYISDGRFAREVQNAEPCRLEFERYRAYVAEKKSTLMATQRTDGADEGRATSIHVVTPQEYNESPRDNASAEEPLPREELEALESAR